MIEKTQYDGIFFAYRGKRKVTLTKNLYPGKLFFRENTIIENSMEYKELNPTRSKLGAAIVKHISQIPIKQNDYVLYLGAAHGYTASFISDIVGNNGVVFCVEMAPRVLRSLLNVCEERKNMIPIMADANKPETYKDNITQVDVIYQDIAQKNQVEILLKNINLFLKPKGYALVAIKARSIDVTKNPKIIFEEVRKELSSKLKIIDSKTLEPLEKDHMFFVCQKK